MRLKKEVSNSKDKKSLLNIEMKSIHYGKEIDYERLAKAIVDAQQSANIVKSPISKLLANIIISVFEIFGIIGMVLSVFVLGMAVKMLFIDYNEYEIIVIVAGFLIVLLICALVFVLSFALVRAAKELEYEKDRQFIVALFSALSSFGAMIVAIIALLYSR